TVQKLGSFGRNDRQRCLCYPQPVAELAQGCELGEPEKPEGISRTLLRCVNYLEPPNAGEVYLEGEPLGSLLDSDGRRRPRSLADINRMRRELGVVFQQYNLWPHMTVLGNVVEARIRVRKLPRREALAIAEECLRRVQLLDKAAEYPARLSGGQQQ